MENQNVSPVAPPPSFTPAPPPTGQSQKQGTSALKVVLIIVAVFVVIGLIVAGLVGFVAWKAYNTVKDDIIDTAQQVQQNNSSIIAKIYNDDYLGFQFNYPSSYVVGADSGMYRYIQSKVIIPAVLVKLNISVDTSDVRWEIWSGKAGSARERLAFYSSAYPIVSDTIVAGIKAQKTKFSQGEASGGIYETIWFEKEGYDYWFNLLGKDAGNNISTFEDMIYTFKFSK